MEKLAIQVELEEDLIYTYNQAPQNVRAQLREGMTQWLKEALRALRPAPQQKDPWLNFLENIQEYAVDTGVEDLSLNHEHYLYGAPKRA